MPQLWLLAYDWLRKPWHASLIVQSIEYICVSGGLAQDPINKIRKTMQGHASDPNIVKSQALFLWQQKRKHLEKQVCTCRNELQQAKMKSQAGQPHSEKGLRQSLERQLQQQVTQLEVSTHVWKFSSFLLMHCLFANMTVESQISTGFL